MPTELSQPTQCKFIQSKQKAKFDIKNIMYRNIYCVNLSDFKIGEGHILVGRLSGVRTQSGVAVAKKDATVGGLGTLVKPPCLGGEGGMWAVPRTCIIICLTTEGK
jgi:hypothetical protein